MKREACHCPLFKGATIYILPCVKVAEKRNRVTILAGFYFKKCHSYLDLYVTQLSNLAIYSCAEKNSDSSPDQLNTGISRQEAHIPVLYDHYNHILSN